MKLETGEQQRKKKKNWKVFHFVMRVLKKGNRNTKSLACMSFLIVFYALFESIVLLFVILCVMCTTPTVC